MKFHWLVVLAALYSAGMSTWIFLEGKVGEPVPVITSSYNGLPSVDVARMKEMCKDSGGTFTVGSDANFSCAMPQ